MKKDTCSECGKGIVHEHSLITGVCAMCRNKNNEDAKLHNEKVKPIVDFKDINARASEKVEELKSGRKVVL